MPLFMSQQARDDMRLRAIKESKYKAVAFRRDKWGYDKSWSWFVLDMNTFPTGKFKCDEYYTELAGKKIPHEKHRRAFSSKRYESEAEALDQAYGAIETMMREDGSWLP